ncbi:MAG: DUF2069 domain-containing protein [Gammaproteobacteria bacterium]|nr:DUF2069 domain-containing protein [Gammaproteobacteria bacterium]MBT8436849.1 DUF2069 domain-containing protein [Gammaproteobacteria bacterium]
MHPLKAISLLSWFSLMVSQLYLLWPGLGIDTYWVILLAVPLLFPLKGLLFDRRYTYQWVGFMTMVYFCIGISLLVSNPQLRFYGFGTTIFSTTLYLSAIYHARLLGLKAKR